MPVQQQVANLSSFQVIPLGDSFLRRPQVGGASSLILAARLRPLAEASPTYQAVCSLHNFTTAQSQLYPNQHSSKNYEYSRTICEQVANAKRFDLHVVIRPLGRESKHSRTLRGRRQCGTRPAGSSRGQCRLGPRCLQRAGPTSPLRLCRHLSQSPQKILNQLRAP